MAPMTKMCFDAIVIYFSGDLKGGLMQIGRNPGIEKNRKIFAILTPIMFKLVNRVYVIEERERHRDGNQNFARCLQILVKESYALA